MSVSRGEFRPGEAVEVHLKLENTGTVPVVLIDIPFQTFDLLIYDRQDRKVWAWTETRALPLGVPGIRHLIPGEALSGVLTWDQMFSADDTAKERLAPRGEYRLEGVLKATLQQAPTLTLRTPHLEITLVP